MLSTIADLKLLCISSNVTKAGYLRVSRHFSASLWCTERFAAALLAAQSGPVRLSILGLIGYNSFLNLFSSFAYFSAKVGLPLLIVVPFRPFLYGNSLVRFLPSVIVFQADFSSEEFFSSDSELLLA